MKNLLFCTHISESVKAQNIFLKSWIHLWLKIICSGDGPLHIVLRMVIHFLGIMDLHESYWFAPAASFTGHFRLNLVSNVCYDETWPAIVRFFRKLWGHWNQINAWWYLIMVVSWQCIIPFIWIGMKYKFFLSRKISTNPGNKFFCKTITVLWYLKKLHVLNFLAGRRHSHFDIFHVKGSETSSSMNQHSRNSNINLRLQLDIFCWLHSLQWPLY